MLVVNDPCRRVILGIVAFHKGHQAGGVDPGQAGVVEPTHVEETVAVTHLLQEVARSYFGPLTYHDLESNILSHAYMSNRL